MGQEAGSFSVAPRGHKLLHAHLLTVLIAFFYRRRSYIKRSFLLSDHQLACYPRRDPGLSHLLLSLMPAAGSFFNERCVWTVLKYA